MHQLDKAEEQTVQNTLFHSQPIGTTTNTANDSDTHYYSKYDNKKYNSNSIGSDSSNSNNNTNLGLELDAKLVQAMFNSTDVLRYVY